MLLLGSRLRMCTSSLSSTCGGEPSSMRKVLKQCEACAGCHHDSPLSPRVTSTRVAPPGGTDLVNVNAFSVRHRKPQLRTVCEAPISEVPGLSQTLCNLPVDQLCCHLAVLYLYPMQQPEQHRQH